MILPVSDLRQAVNDKIKVIPNNATDKTQAADVKQLLVNILDTVDDLVKQQGLSISSTVNSKETAIYSRMDSDVVQVTNAIDTKVNAAKPDLTSFAKVSQLPDLSTYWAKADSIPYTKISGTPILFDGKYSSLVGAPIIPTYDLTLYAKKTDPISYTNLTDKPTLFDGSYNSLSSKPVIPTYDLSIYQKTTDAIPYTRLTGTPTIPTYDLSLYRLKTEAIDYTALTNKPTIVTDYSQLANKPSMSRLLWNQIVPVPVTNTVSEVNTLVTGNGTLNIDANPIVGTSFRVSGRGLFSLQTLTSPTLTVKFYLGGVLIATGTSSSLLLGASNKSFSFGMDILVTTSNSVYSQGFFSYYAGATDALSSTPLLNSSGGLSNTTVDLSVSNQLKLTFTWSVASASNQILVKVANFEKLNN